jgi:hypothetical protein
MINKGGMMTKRLSFLSAVIFMVLLHMQLSSQVRYALGPSLGFTIPSADYSGTTVDYYNGTRYGLGSGVTFGGTFKARLKVVTVRADINYTPLSNTGNSEPGQGLVEVKHNIFSVGVGMEFPISIPGKIRPFAGVQLQLNTFSGETTFQGVSRVPSGTYSMSSATRTGVGFGAGIEITLGKNYILELGAKYSFLNLMGKSFSGGTERLNSYTGLNDEADPFFPDDKHPIGNDRLISVIQFNAAFLFGF